MPDEEIVEKEAEELERKIQEERNRENDADRIKDLEQASDVEALAKQMGWNPEHKDGDREYKTAEEFILNGREIQNTMSKQLKSTKREVEGLKSGITLLKEHNETVYNVQVKALKGKIRDLQVQREDAVTDKDEKAVAAIDSQIKEINDIPDKLPASAVDPSPVFLEWEEKNDWYENNEMRAYADWQGENNIALRGLPEKKFLSTITKMVKVQFPEHFPQKTKKAVAAAVESGSRSATKTKTGAKLNDLSREQQDIAKQLADSGIMSVEDYIKDLEKIAEARQ